MKLKLRMWVKVVFIVIVIGSIVMASNKRTNEAVEQCINAGHSVNYCETGLR